MAALRIRGVGSLNSFRPKNSRDDVLLDLAEELVEPERLFEPGGRSKRGAVHRLRSVGADDNDGDVGELGIGELSGPDLGATSAGKDQVQQHQGDAVGA